MDFVKVMCEQQRMCETIGDCENCPLNHFHCGPDACENEDELREYEERVMTWARELDLHLLVLSMRGENGHREY